MIVSFSSFFIGYRLALNALDAGCDAPIAGEIGQERGGALRTGHSAPETIWVVETPGVAIRHHLIPRRGLQYLEQMRLRRP
jgi:hypothetical protein